MKRSITILFLLAATICQIAAAECDSVKLVYKLHGQTRRFNTSFCHRPDSGITMSWDIVRNLKTWRGSYSMSPEAVANGNTLSYLMPEDGNHATLSRNETFAILSRHALEALDKEGRVTLNGIEWERTSTPGSPEIVARNTTSGACMTVANNPSLPLILSMQGNPLEIKDRKSVV